MTRLLRALILTIVLGLVAAPALAQSQDLQLTVRRDFGYGGGDQIQGLFTLQATGPADLASVTFKVDDQVVGTVAAAPFQVSFNTDSYPLGWHTLTAEGQTAAGQKLASAPRRFEFVSASTGVQSVGRIALPIVGVLVLIGAIALIATFLDIRRSKASPTPLGAVRQYGIMGGAICPKCGRPFSRHWWAPNAGLGKLDRCPHCGRWSLVRAVPLEQLRAAEAAELKQDLPTGPASQPSAEEALRKQLDDSRFEGG
jgi:hypothetical protein